MSPRGSLESIEAFKFVAVGYKMKPGGHVKVMEVASYARVSEVDLSDAQDQCCS